MIWSWWLAMAGVGIVAGCVGAWAQQGARVFMKTLAVPVILVLSRLLFPNLYPFKNGPGYVLIDFLIIAVTGLAADYVVGLRLGRHDRGGYRSDSVGH